MTKYPLGALCRAEQLPIGGSVWIVYDDDFKLERIGNLKTKPVEEKDCVGLSDGERYVLFITKDLRIPFLGDPDGFVFSNFWHAYAYALRQKP